MRRGRFSALSKKSREEMAGFVKEGIGEDEEERPIFSVIVIVAIV